MYIRIDEMEAVQPDNISKNRPFGSRLVGSLVQRYKAQPSPLPGTLPGSEAFVADWEEGGSKHAFHGLGESFNEMFPDNPQVLRRTLSTLAGSVLWGLGVTAVLPLLAYSWDNRVSEGYTGTDPNKWPDQQRQQITWTNKEAKAANDASTGRGVKGCSADKYASRVQSEGLLGKKAAEKMNKKYDEHSRRK